MIILKKLRCIDMASSKEYLNFILEQISRAEDVSYRSMMGETIKQPFEK